MLNCGWMQAMKETVGMYTDMEEQSYTLYDAIPAVSSHCHSLFSLDCANEKPWSFSS